MPGIRSSEIEKNKRVQIIAKLILEGYSNTHILLQIIAEKYKSWGKEDRMIYNYIKEAKALLSEIAKNDIEFERELVLNRLEALYTMNYKIQDFRECRNIIESRSKILGINAPTKVEVNTSTKSFEDFLSNINAVKDGFNSEISE